MSVSVAAFVAAISISSTASASFVFSSGISEMGLGSFSGEMSFTATGATTGTLSVTLTNTSPVANGGWLTAFAFDVIDGLSLTLASAPSASWGLLTNASGSPFGTFDFGASTSNSWEGGGPPSLGIGVGGTGVWTFAVTAVSSAVLSGATEASFFDATDGHAFVVRFRGFEDGNSDKVVGVPVPAPGAIALLGLAGLVARRRR
jgi:MYXO-CTERM domain-containing protein